MKYKIATFLLLGITIILCFGYFKQRQEISKLNAQSQVIGKTDTVYISKPFKYEPAFSTVQLPRYVFFYYPNSIKGDSLKKEDKVVSKKDSLIQIVLDKKDLFLSFQNTIDSTYFKLDYKINLDDFKYNWVNGQLTREKVGFRLKLEPYVYAKYRYFNKMADAGIGISFKTRNLQYKLGLNGFYYPCLQDKIGTDLEFSITYNLSK